MAGRNLASSLYPAIAALASGTPAAAANARAAAIALGLWHPLARWAGSLAHTGDTVETTLVTVNVPANAMGVYGMLRITSLWALSSSTNVKTPRVKFNGTAYSAVAISTSGIIALQDLTIISNQNSLTSQVGDPANYGGIGTSAAAIVTSAHDTATALDLTFTAQLADAGDTITLRRYIVEVLK